MRLIHRLASTALLACCPLAGPSRLAAAEPDDWQLALAARQAVNSDPKLVVLNLGVTVKAGAATLYGPAPSEELARRAEARVRSVRGLKAVFNDLHLAPPDDPNLRDLVRALEQAEPQQPLPAPVALLDRDGPAMQAPPARRLQPAPMSSLFTQPKPALQPTILPPRADHTTTIATATPTSGAVLASPTPAKTRINAADGIAVVQREQRYRGLQVHLDKGIASINGKVEKWPDLWEFAESLARQTGVDRVRIENVVLKDAANRLR